jgi:hypothetical protein
VKPDPRISSRISRKTPSNAHAPANARAWQLHRRWTVPPSAPPSRAENSTLTVGAVTARRLARRSLCGDGAVRPSRLPSNAHLLCSTMHLSCNAHRTPVIRRTPVTHCTPVVQRAPVIHRTPVTQRTTVTHRTPVKQPTRHMCHATYRTSTPGMQCLYTIVSLRLSKDATRISVKKKGPNRRKGKTTRRGPLVRLEEDRLRRPRS